MECKLTSSERQQAVLLDSKKDGSPSRTEDPEIGNVNLIVDHEVVLDDENEFQEDQGSFKDNIAELNSSTSSEKESVDANFDEDEVGHENQKSTFCFTLF